MTKDEGRMTKEARMTNVRNPKSSWSLVLGHWSFLLSFVLRPSSLLAALPLLMVLGAFGGELRIAGVTTAYYQNTHADMIIGRLLQGFTLDGRAPFPKLKLASLHVEQFPENDKSKALAAQFRVPMFGSAEEAVTLGTGRLAVDGVLLVAEHGKYPESDIGSIVYPKRRMFAEIAQACERAERGVPVFIDKHLADNWTDAKWIYDEAQRLKMPLMAGSSVPGLWREPPIDTERDRPLKEIAAVSYHRLDTYGIHALEMVQCLAERRKGGETGVKQVRTLTGDEVWKAIDSGLVDGKLLERAARTQKNRPLPRDKQLRELVKQPNLFVIEYRDGLKASVLTLEQLYIDWAAAWKYDDDQTQSAVFWTQEARPFQHFGVLVHNLEPFFATGEPTWPVERTLLTTGMLDALLISHRDGGKVVQTPQLEIRYQSKWNWKQPPPPPPDRPINEP
jgi:hypothetical protein